MHAVAVGEVLLFHAISYQGCLVKECEKKNKHAK